jgi:glucose-6-phosphate-specific signal transduction histidine kinase
VLACGIFLVAGCTGAELLLFVLAAECQMVFPLVTALTVTVGLWLLSVLIVALNGFHAPGETWGQFLATSPAGFAFVAAFTYNALGERRLRIHTTELLEELNQAHQQLQSYTDQVEELAVASRTQSYGRRDTRHPGHYLTVVNVQLETAMKLQERNPEAAAEAISVAKVQAAEALSEVRRSVAALRPAGLDAGFSEALALFIDSLRKSTDLKIHLETHSTERLPPEIEVVAYRVIQEALTNVRKHARARNVWIRLKADDQGFDGEIRDDGRGAKDFESQGSFGLQSMRERLGGAGGWLRTQSIPGEGFSVEFHIPPQHRRVTGDPVEAGSYGAGSTPPPARSRHTR